MERRQVPANRPWATVVGYSRAVRIGNQIEVSGTASADRDGAILHPGDVYRQTKECLQIIRDALEGLGSSLSDVIRTRVFMCDIARWEEVGRAHGEVFSKTLPAATFIEVNGFIDPEILVEIEASAVT